MAKRIVNPDGLAPPRGFNHGILVDDGQLLFLAGQTGHGSDGELVASDLVSQFEQTMKNLAAVIEEAGGSPDDIVKLNIYVADRDEYRANLEPLGVIFGRYVEDYPALALFEVSDFFEQGVLVEMEGFGVIDPE